MTTNPTPVPRPRSAALLALLMLGLLGPAFAAAPATAAAPDPVKFEIRNTTMETLQLLDTSGPGRNMFVNRPAGDIRYREWPSYKLLSNGVPAQDHVNLRYRFSSGGLNYDDLSAPTGFEVWITRDPTPATPGRYATCTIRDSVGAIVHADAVTPRCDYSGATVTVQQPDVLLIPVLGSGNFVLSSSGDFDAEPFTNSRGTILSPRSKGIQTVRLEHWESSTSIFFTVTLYDGEVQCTITSSEGPRTPYCTVTGSQVSVGYR